MRMRIVSTTAILLLWTTKDLHQTSATLPGMLMPLPLMQRLARRILSSTSSTPLRPRPPAASTPKYREYRQHSSHHHHQHQNQNHQQQQHHGFIKLHNLLEQSKQSTFASTGQHENWSGQDDRKSVPPPLPLPLQQKFTLSEGHVLALTPDNSNNHNHGIPQLSPANPPHHHNQHRPVPLTFPPSSVPPPPPYSDSYPRIISLPPISPAYHLPPQHQQQQPQSSSHYSTSSLQYTFQNGYTTGYEAPTPKKVVRHVSVFVAPPDNPYNSGRQKIHVPGNAEKHVNIIFIKGPESSQANLAEVNLPPIPEQKTLVYVLNKAQDGAGQVIVNTPEPPKYSPPDVYFIKYKDGQNGHQQQQEYGAPHQPPPQEKSDQHQYGPPPQEKSDQQQYGGPPVIQHPQYHHQITPSPPTHQHFQPHQPPPPSQQHHHVAPTEKPQQTYNAPSQHQQQQQNSLPEQLLPPPLQEHQHQSTPTHVASSNQKFNYTYPSIINSTRVIPANLSKPNPVKCEGTKNVSSAISPAPPAAERRIEDQIISDSDSDHSSHNFKYDISYHSLVNSEEESDTNSNTVEVDGTRKEHHQTYGKLGVKTGNGLYPAESPLFPNSRFFQPLDIRQQIVKKKQDILSLINAIFSTKANTSTKSLSSSPPIVKYNVADRILAVRNGSSSSSINPENISFGMGARAVYPGSKNVKRESSSSSSSSNNNIKGLRGGEEVAGVISQDQDDGPDPNLFLLTRQNLTTLTKDLVEEGTPPVTLTIIEKADGGGVDGAVNNGLGSGSSKSPNKQGSFSLISGRIRPDGADAHFSPYKYAPSMGYHKFGINYS